MNDTVRRLFARRPFLAFVWTSVALILLLSLIGNTGTGKVALIAVLVAWVFVPFAASRYLSYRKQAARNRRIKEAEKIKTNNAKLRAASLLDTVAVVEDKPINETTCAICLQDDSIPGKWVKLKVCDHEFHESCMREVITHDEYDKSRGMNRHGYNGAPVASSSSCPLCRAPLIKKDRKSSIVSYSNEAIVRYYPSNNYTTNDNNTSIPAAAAALYLGV